ncbi:hypothetical protein HNP84_002486 [Thermocatellispora tengchongensis]|uniref:Uncharacterized protein n=1 Tax=Thermocatellispora tengchongensis TaxID=1073253 RepID=A0A840P9U2_9ACTN|nr:hypothetical protein [Thermocatellispora tengchongensis]MBB5132765.1 hypothetical protein [Thermocatellispora tengchongensis]
MTRKPRPAVNPNTSHSLITAKAHLCGWAIATCPTYTEGVTELALTRDDWKIFVGFQAGTAFAAAILYPGQTHPAGILSLGLLTRYLRGNRKQMSAFRRGQRVIVGDQAGVVQDIIPDDEVKVRLIVVYDGGGVGEPYTTHVRAEEEAPV